MPEKLHQIIQFKYIKRCRIISASYTRYYIYLQLAKDEELSLKAASYKLDWYINRQLTLWCYKAEYVFCGLSKMRIYLHNARLDWRSERCIRDKRVNYGRSTISRLTLSLSVFIFTFFSSSLPAQKEKESIKRSKTTYLTTWILLSFHFLPAKPRYDPPKNSFRQNFKLLFFLFLVVQYTGTR